MAAKANRAKKAAAPADPKPPYQPTDQERAAMKAHFARRGARMNAPRVKLEPLPSGGICIGPDHPMRALWAMALQQVFGTVSPDFAGPMLRGLSDAATLDSNTTDEPALNGMLAALHGINPVDEVEAMLAAQMVATHLAAMDCLKRAQLTNQTFEGRDMNLRHAAKLTRTYTMQVEALKRYRSKGEQRVVVQHQHVNVAAEQAAVQVTSGANSAPRGRGAAPKPEERSHAQADTACLAHASEPPMPCPNPARDTVPAAGCRRAEAMPDARRS
jgi:hypothetical protein